MTVWCLITVVGFIVFQMVTKAHGGHLLRFLQVNYLNIFVTVWFFSIVVEIRVV